MADIKKYLDQAGLQELVAQIKAADVKVGEAANAYADGLAKNYDAAGAAASVKTELQGTIDGLNEVYDAKGAAAAVDEKLTAEVTRATGKEAELEASIGGVKATADKAAEDILAINNAETGILAQAKADATQKANAVQANVDELAGLVGTLPEGTTAKDVVDYVNIKTAGIATDAALGELQNQLSGVQGEVATIKGDYLKGSDKTELEGKINAKADQTALDAVSEVANAAVKQSDYNTKVAALEAEDARIVDLVEAEASRADGVEKGLDARIKAVEDDYLKAADKEALQTQINTIMNNPDAEGAINSINEFTQYVEEHGTIADGFRTDIDKNKEDIAANAKAIEDLGTSAASTYATKQELNNTEAYLDGEIDKRVQVVADDLAELTEVVGTKVDQTAYNEKIAALEGADSKMADRLDAIELQLGDGEGSVADMIEDAKQAAITAATDAAAADATTKANTAETNAKSHADGLNTAMNARVEALETVDHEHANKELLDSYDQTNANIKNAVDKAHEHANKAVIDAIDADKVAAWDAAEQNAKDFATGLNNTLTATVNGIDGRLATAEAAVATKAEQDDLDAAVERIAANETAIAANAAAIAGFQPIPTGDITALFA